MTKQTFPKIQKRTLSRRAKIVEIIITTGQSSQTQLALQLGVQRQTIAEDIAVITQNGTEWLDGFAAVGWVMMWQEQVHITLQQIKSLQDEMKKATTEKEDATFEFAECPFDVEADPTNYFKWLSEYRKALSSFFLKSNNFLETAALSRSLSMAQQTLQQLVEREVLYKKVQSLQIFYENNKPRELVRTKEKKTLKVIKTK